jgi:TonB family protein
MRPLMSVASAVICAFFLCPAIVSQVTTPSVPPQDPKGLMLAAARLNNMIGVDTLPWHIKGTWRILDESGAVMNEGTYEEFWVSPKSSKRIYTGKDFTQTEYTTDKGDFRASSSHGDLPPLLTSAHNDLISPMPNEQTIVHTTYSAKPFENGDLKLTCISQAAVPGASTLCLANGEPLLRIYSVPAFTTPTQALYNRVLRFNDKAVAGDLKLVNGGKVILSLHVDTLESLDTKNEVAFMPPTDGELVPIPRRIYISAGVAAGMIVRKVAPEYPFDAKSGRISGTVTLQALIDTDGKVKDLKVVSGPAALQKAAVEAVRQWKYRPYLLNGSPVEVMTTINVIFTLG